MQMGVWTVGWEIPLARLPPVADSAKWGEFFLLRLLKKYTNFFLIQIQVRKWTEDNGHRGRATEDDNR